MKKLLFFILFLYAMVCHAQVPADTTALRSQINTNIVTNGTGAITAVKLQNILNGQQNFFGHIGAGQMTSGKLDTARLPRTKIIPTYPLVATNDSTLAVSSTFLDSSNLIITTIAAPAATLVGKTLNIPPLANNEDPTIATWQYLGSVIKAQPIGLDINRCTANGGLTSGTLVLTAFNLLTPQILTGVKYVMAQAGSYTGDASNQVGLYTYSGGTFTLVDSCVDDATIWKATANTLANKAFANVYNATTGIYFVGILYHSSAQVTQPQLIAAPNSPFANAHKLDFTNSSFIAGTITTQTFLPTSIAASSLTVTGANLWISIY